MDVLTTTVAALVAILAAAVIWLAIAVGRRTPGDAAQIQAAVDNLKAELIGKQMEGMLALRQTLDSVSRGLNERLADGQTALDRRLTVVTDIEHKLGELQRQTESIEEIGRNIQSLSDLLKPPKLRGGLGELLLENLLAQILPSALYDVQFGFRDGSRVDAIIRLGDRILPIDSKFPLEAFQRLQSEIDLEQSSRDFRRAIKGQVDAISTKYIRPDEETTDFAVMYIPSEAVYYRLISEEGSDLFAYALGKKVIPSSPGHLYAFLASVAAVYAEAGLAGNTRRLSAVLNALRESLERLDRTHERMAGSTRVLGQSLDKARTESVSMKQQLESLHEVPEPAGLAEVEVSPTEEQL